MARLTKKEKQFIQEYLVDLNATQAAIRAKYSPATARQIGAELMTKEKIRDAIEEAMAIRARRTGITQDRVLNEIAKVAFLNATDVIDMDEATIRGDANREDTAAIASVRVKTIPTEVGNITEREVKTYDKLKALELIGKHIGLFSDSLKLSGEVSVKIVDDIGGLDIENSRNDE